MRLNHFPLNPELMVYQTTYVHPKPQAFASFLRHKGFVAEQIGGRVLVYHALPVPVFRGAMAEYSERLQAGDGNFSRGVTGLIRQTLVGAGYVLIDQGRAALHPIVERQNLQTPRHQPVEVAVYAHLRWEWELEWHSDRTWLVLRPGRKFLSALPWRATAVQGWAGRLSPQVGRLHALCWDAGRRARLVRENDVWSFQGAAGEGRWHLSFSTETLKDLDLSGDAHHTALPDMDELLRLVQLPGLWQPFVSSLEPCQPVGNVIQGQRLRFGRGLGRDVSEIHKKGMLSPPTLPVRLVVVPPQLADEQEASKLRRELLAHLLPRKQVLAHQEAAMGLRKDLNRREEDDTLYTFWSAGQYQGRSYLRLGLEPFDLVRGLHPYDLLTGDLLSPDAMKGKAQQAEREGRQLIGLTVLPDGLGREARDALFANLKALGIQRLQSVSRAMLNRTRPEYMAWVNVAVKLARTAGAVPWDVVDMPGVTPDTMFIGVDLGHDHKNQESVPAFSLHDHLGRPVRGIVLPRRRNNERLELEVLRQGFQKVLKQQRPAHVIVHRDGRFLPGEVDDFVMALHDLGIASISLLAVKKSTYSMVADVQDGTVLPLSGDRCLLVTNTQASVARPSELQLMYSDSLTFEQLTEQAFWLTRVFMNNVQHPGSDPATVEWANGMARTGQRIKLPGWERSGAAR